MATMTISSDEGEVYEVDKIIDVRKRGRSLQYLVKWKGYDSDEETWETEKNMEFAKDAIDEFNKKQKAVVKTPTRRSTKQVETFTSQDGKGSKNVTQTTTVTKVTRTVSGTQSESSSPESSPLLGRRVMQQTHTVIKQKTSKPISSFWSDKNGLCTWSPSRLISCQWCSSMQLSTIIVLLCFVFIVLTFVIQPTK